MHQWHSLKIQEVLKTLESDKKGLSEKESKKRQQKYGLNELIQEKKVSAWRIFFHQFTDFLVLILIAAALISFVTGQVFHEEGSTLDTILIVIILVANGVFSFIQNYKAEKSIESLRNLATPTAIVLRNGHKEKVEAKTLVPGDIIVLEEGDLIPADARVMESFNLKVDEATLTGESVPVNKETEPLQKELALGDRLSMVYMSTFVVGGTGKAVVTSIGMETEVGHIAKRLQMTSDRATPFQTELAKLGKKIGLSIIILAILIIVAQLFTTGFTLSSLLPVFIFGASLAVAAVPEGLPAVVTVGLAIGSRRMVKKKALVRHLAVVESLGSVDIICTDKTGTLTEGMMTVRQVYVDGKVIEVTGQGYDAKGKFEGLLKKNEPDLKLLLKAGALCNKAEWQSKKNFVGDPTEIALLVSAQKAKLTKELQGYTLMNEMTFSSERKMMSMVFKKNKDVVLFAKGAPEMILEKCSAILHEGKELKLTAARKKEILKMNENFAGKALRVLGFAYQKGTEKEKNLVFLGLQGMMDPPRKEVPKAIEDCKKAGIRVIMITGDHPITAAAIAQELKLSENAEVLTGQDLSQLSQKQLEEKVSQINVFARVNPEHKVDILKALQKLGHRVAMTGDGVNDAPAVKQADVGIVMGIRGTDVAKQASDMVLLDDNFATIRSAIREGRGIFDNIRKFVNFLLSANAGEVILILFSLLYGRLIFGLDELLLPVLAVHLLWINLLTDGLPALALSVDPISHDVMKRPPRSTTEGVIDRPTAIFIFVIGFVIALITLIVFLLHLNDPVHARTMAFTTLVILELAKIDQVRNQYKLPFFSNPWLIGAALTSFLLQLIILYTPLSEYFQIMPLSLADWGLIALALLIFWIFSRAFNAWMSRGAGDFSLE